MKQELELHRYCEELQLGNCLTEENVGWTTLRNVLPAMLTRGGSGTAPRASNSRSHRGQSAVHG